MANIVTDIRCINGTLHDILRDIDCSINSIGEETQEDTSIPCGCSGSSGSSGSSGADGSGPLIFFCSCLVPTTLYLSGGALGATTLTWDGHRFIGTSSIGGFPVRFFCESGNLFLQYLLIEVWTDCPCVDCSHSCSPFLYPGSSGSGAICGIITE